MQLLRFASASGLDSRCLAAGGVRRSDAVDGDRRGDPASQDSIYDASRDVASCDRATQRRRLRCRPSSTTRATRAIYLKVKLRRNEPVSRASIADVRDRVENIRESRARRLSRQRLWHSTRTPIARPTTSTSRTIAHPADNRYRPPSREPYRPTNRPPRMPNEIPVDTEFDVRLQNSAQLGDRAGRRSLRGDDDGRLRDERGRVLVPAGSVDARRGAAR